MIEQEGIVVETRPEVIVQVQAQSSCGACQNGSGCGAGVLGRLFTPRSLKTRVHSPVDSALQIKKGDTVVIALEESVLLQSAITLYFLPVVLMGVLAIAGQQLVADIFGISPDMAAISLGMVGLFSGLLLCRWTASRSGAGSRLPIIIQRKVATTVPPPVPII